MSAFFISMPIKIEPIVLDNNKNSSFNWQQRRHGDWTENYQLYRDKVVINRLTQRQSVNIPLMKETIRTILSRTDDAPDLAFEELGNDKQKDIFINEYWKHCFDKTKLVLKDIVDKKQVGLYGRSWKKLNVVAGNFYTEILDPFDVLIDRYVDPSDVDTAGHIIHLHIYRTLKRLENNPFYDKAAIGRLKSFYATSKGLVKASENFLSAVDKNERMQSMGVPDVDNPLVGETYIELNEHFVKVWNSEIKGEEIYLVVKADSEILLSMPLEKVIGATKDHYWRTHYPFTSWADDIERTDFYSDGTGDTVRTPNKIANSWWSQLIENRTLRNFGLQFYNTMDNKFIPQTVDPEPFGWYGVPGNPNELVKRVDIPDLSDTREDLAFLINIVEKATAATATEKGETSKGKITLGEVKLVSEKALERITSMAKFYRQSHKEFGEKWVKMIEANADNLNVVKLYKKSVKGNFFEKTISPKDWKSEIGYNIKVTSTAEQEKEGLDTIQKLDLVTSKFQGNDPLLRIYQHKLLELGKLSPDEIKEVMDFEKQKAKQNLNPLGGGMMPANMGETKKQLMPVMA